MGEAVGVDEIYVAGVAFFEAVASTEGNVGVWAESNWDWDEILVNEGLKGGVWSGQGG